MLSGSEKGFAVIEALLLNLRSRDGVSLQEEQILRVALTRDRRFELDEDLVAQGSRPEVSTLLLDGFAARYTLTRTGSRQITALHVAGDFVDLHAFLLKEMDHGVMALSPCRVALVDHSEMKRITEQAPHLSRLLWLGTVVDAAIHRERIVAMGRKSGKAQLSHLICELYVRLQVVKRTTGLSFNFPISQIELADVMGVSVVHLNRTIQGLRRDGLLTWANRTVTIENWDRLQELAEFDPTYLSLSDEPR